MISESTRTAIFPRVNSKSGI